MNEILTKGHTVFFYSLTLSEKYTKLRYKKADPLHLALLSFCYTHSNILVLQRSHLKVKALYDDDDDDDDDEGDNVDDYDDDGDDVYLEVYGNVGDNHGDQRNSEGHAVEHWFWCVAL